MFPPLSSSPCPLSLPLGEGKGVGRRTGIRSSHSSYLSITVLRNYGGIEDVPLHATQYEPAVRPSNTCMRHGYAEALDGVHCLWQAGRSPLWRLQLKSLKTL